MSPSLPANPWWWILTTLLAMVVFLVMLNGFLRGAWKPQIDAVLGGLYAALLIMLFLFFGWRVGCVSILGRSFWEL